MAQRQSLGVMVDVEEKGDNEPIRPFEPRYLHFRTGWTFFLEFHIEAERSNLIWITILIFIEGRAIAIGRNHKHARPLLMSHLLMSTSIQDWIYSAAENSQQS